MASESEKVNKAVKKILDSISVDVLKEEQRQILDAMLANKDCMAVLPTGFGKSLPFQIFLPVQWKLNKSYKKKLIVCSPLVALMEDQVTKTSRIPHLTAAYRGSSPESDNLIKEGDVDVIFASPESLVGDPGWRSVVQQLEISAIVIDEFHTIATWGEDDGKKKAFRKWFSHLGELRSLCPSACVIALSATCTNKIRRRVTKVLHLMPNYVDIRISPNKPNIKIVCGSVPNTVDTALAWMVEGLSEMLEGFPRTVLYCNTIKDTSKVYSYFTDGLPQLKEIIEMFHGSTPESTKKDILKKVTDKESNIRIIICTSALGMGVDLADFHSVIIYGCPEHSVDFIQEIGRVGRDGDSSVALNNSYHRRRVEKELKDAVMKDSDGCR